MKSRSWVRPAVILWCFLMSGLTPAWALNSAVNSGWWTNDATWDGGKPGLGHDVFIPAGMTVTVSEATAVLNSFTNSGVLVFTNWNNSLTASDVVVRAGGSITCAGPFADTAGLSNRVWIVCTNLLVETNGLIDVNGKGFDGGAAGSSGKGPGAGAYGVVDVGSGGGHGGSGGSGKASGTANTSNPGGYIYDSTNEPSVPGSGGGGGFFYTHVRGGAGGGAIRIAAVRDVTVFGTIRASGGNGGYDSGTGRCGGGGSGGSILILCSTLKGSTNGLITVGGGNSSAGGLGGGGRIAVSYDSAMQGVVGNQGVRFSAAPGITGLVSSASYPLYGGTPSWGTVWLPDSTLISANASNLLMVGLARTNDWTVSSFTLVSNTVGIVGSGSRLIVTGDIVIGAGATQFVAEGAALHCGGNLILTNGGALYVYGGVTNATTPDYGALVSVTGGVFVAPGSWIYSRSQPTNGGSPLFRMRSLTVATNAGINAQGSGFAGGATANKQGYGPGKGQGDATGNAKSGGGYGGLAGGAVAPYGQTYGSLNAPVDPGSGGGSDSSGGHGGRGGGLVRIEADETVVLDGTILANGVPGGSGSIGARAAGGGSGGAIFVLCEDFLGGGSMSANGGIRSDTGKGGGGGRIAVGIGLSAQQRTDLIAGNTVEGLQVNDRYGTFNSGNSFATGGTNTAGASGSNGTVRFLTVAAADSYSLVIAGSPGLYGSPAPDTYATYNNIPANTPKTNSVTTPSGVTATSRWVLVNWILKNTDTGVTNNSDVTSQAEFTVTTNLTLTWYWARQYSLTVAAGAGGGVNSGTVDGWYTNGASVAGIQATPAEGYAFNEWIGDVPPGMATENPLTVTMDRARTITASFRSLAGETKTWNGSGAWESTTNWTPSGMPGPLDTVTIQSGTSLLSVARHVESLTVSSGASLIFTNWNTSLTAADVAVQSGSTITCAGPFANTAGLSNRVWIVCTNLLVETNGLINVDGKGYVGGAGIAGAGPGGGSMVGGGYGTGAGHGGVGGPAIRDAAYYPNLAGGNSYGSTNQPLSPGSAGGGGVSGYGIGGNGGGAIRIEAALDVTIYGTVRANGNPGQITNTRQAGGGSGGSIYITCRALRGSTNGLISVAGGSGDGGGIGAGGRIAVSYDTATQQTVGNPGVRFTAAAGSSGLASSPDFPLYGGLPSWGTLWLTDAALISANAANLLNLGLASPTNWAPTSLTLINNTVGFIGSGMRLTVANDIVVGAGASLAIGENATLDCRGNLTLTNSGALYAYSGPTNASTPSYGVLVGVSGDVAVATGSWVYVHSQQVNGGSPLFKVRNLTVATNAGFTAEGRGFAGAAVAQGIGYGYGKGQGANPNAISGAGYGGLGGGASGAYGQTYGSSNAPIHAGSGGGSDGNGGYGGRGGGLVRIEAEQTVTLAGTINASGRRGGNSSGLTCSSGSGGGIFILCNEMLGENTGIMRAAGGSREDSGRAGGGGRIAVAIGLNPAQRAELLGGTVPAKAQILPSYPRFQGAATVAGGTSSGGASGGDGTVVWLWVEGARGTTITIR